MKPFEPWVSVYGPPGRPVKLKLRNNIQIPVVAAGRMDGKFVYYSGPTLHWVEAPLASYPIPAEDVIPFMRQAARIVWRRPNWAAEPVPRYLDARLEKK